MKDKIVIITGASSGIGLATAIAIAEEKAKVVLASRNIVELKKIEERLINKGNNVFAVQCDVSIEKDCENLIKETINKYGRIDILINNAGVTMRAMFANVEISVLKKLMDVNFWGTAYCTKYALPYLLSSKGVLAGISSIAGFHGLPGRSGYSASKFAIHGLLESIRIENLKTGLHVVIIAPAFARSNIRERALNAKGNVQGFSPRNEEKMMSAERVAFHIIKAIKRKKRNRIISFEGQMVALFQRILPETVDKIAYRKMANEPDSPFR